MATLILNATQLQAMNDDLTADYELGANINASATSTWNEDPGNPGTYFGFDPIGMNFPYFTGSFDGKGYTINNLYINRPSYASVGLFGVTGDGCGTIQNAVLVDCDITGRSFTGALIGYQSVTGGAVSTCYSTGSVSGERSGSSSLGAVGGLIGYATGSITSCYSTCAVTATHTGTSYIDSCGGLIGSHSAVSTVTSCYAAGAISITAQNDILLIGGLIGNTDAVVSKCYSTGSVTIDAGEDADQIGGFIGENTANISDCYARGDVTITAGVTANSGDIGGFVGLVNRVSAILDDCYSTGAITATDIPDVGGFCGDNSGTVTNCFWDTQTSGEALSDGGTGKTTAQMKTEATFTDAGWDFSTIWSIEAVTNDGYPALIAVGTAPTVTTQAVSSIAATTATGNGNITDLGSPDPIAHGVCYNTTGSPTVADSTTDEGAAATTGAFTSSMTSLSINTKYYVKAYAANAVDTSYGSEVNFTTLGIPTIITQTCESVLGAAATGRGDITVIGNPTPTAHGHCWKTSADPTTGDDVVDNGAASVIGTFTSAITGLTPGTGYYTRAFATNTEGTVYGDNVYFVASTARAGYTWDESSNLRSFDENALERQYIHTDDVDDSPADGATTDPISSNWAFDHVAAADPHTGYVLESLFDAQTILQATSDNTPTALTLTEQTLAGRLTGGNISAVTIGIANDNILQVDHTSPTDDDYAKFTTAGLEGRSYSEVASDIQSSIDHGSIAGLTDDDHPHYLLRTIANGSFKETFDATVASNGTVVTMSLEKSGTGDLIMQFSDGLTTLDCTPAATIALTAGSDASPQANWIYIPQSTKVLTLSTSAWPSAEHIKVGFFFVQSAASVQTAGGVIINQNWNDHLAGTDSQGHLLHIAEKLRLLNATYFDGIDGNGTTGYLTITAGNVEFKSTAGHIYQLHKGTFSALDTSGGDTVHVKNWSGDAYHAITNLHDITADSGGNAIGNNKYFNLVMWGIQNKAGEHQTVLINLPSGFYNTQADAESDVSRYDDFTIPREFNIDSSVGFLICLITIKMGSTWTHMSTVDLRGTTPQTASGGAAGIISSFADNAFDVFDESDTTKVLVFDVGTNVTTGNTRTVQVPDANGIMAYTSQTNGTIDHGADLAGLGDDDHTQYFLLAGEATDAKLYSGADLIVYSGAGSSEVARIDGATGNITTAGTVDGIDVSVHDTATTGVHGVSGTIVGTSDSQALTSKSYNGLTLTSTTGTFTLASGKTFTVSNTLTLTATDTATLAIGSGGTLGSAAYTASTDYLAKSTFEAHSLVIAINDNAPVVLELAASRMVGRASSGNIVALAKADILTIINVTEGADVTGNNPPQAHTTSHTDGTDDIRDAAADDSTKGISTFEADDFDSSSGKIDLAVSVTKASTTDSGTATPTAHDLNIVGGEGIDTSASGVVVTIAGEAASTTNIGVVELATGGETNTGTSATLAVTPDGLDDWTGSAQIATVGTVTSGTLSTGAVLADVTMTLGSDADGDVYYRASNKLTRLAKGSASDVLTMNAGGTAPEWAAASGDGDGATKEIFIPVSYTKIGSDYYIVAEGDYAVAEIPAAGTECATTFMVPHDFTSKTTVELIGIANDGNGSAKMKMHITTDYAAIGQAKATHSESSWDQDSEANANDGDLLKWDISGVLSAIAVGDYVGVLAQGTATELATDCFVLGIKFRYS